MRLQKPPAPFKKLNVIRDSITIDVDATNLVIPTGNQNVIPSFNEFMQNPNRITTAPCGGLKDSIVQDKFPGALSIEGDGCYLQTTDGTYTGKSIGAGKLSETSSIVDSGTTGITLATADGIEVLMGDGNPILLRPPYAIVEEFQVVNISSTQETYTVTLKSPDSIESIELHNLTSSYKENIQFTKISMNEYTFSKSIYGNTTESFQLTIIYNSLDSTQTFSDDANTTIGLENMSESWIALIPTTGHDIDFIHFSERPRQLSYKRASDGMITQITIYPGNGSVYHGQITHPDHTRVSGSGYVPDIFNKNMHGSITKFLQSHGMKTNFPSDATITTWIVPAISDTKILPLSQISDDYLGDEISLRMCPGETGCASFVIQLDRDSIIEIVSLIHDSESIVLDIKSVKCWFQNGYEPYNNHPRGIYLTPELLLHDDSIINVVGNDWGYSTLSLLCGQNWLKSSDGTYSNISQTTPSTDINDMTQVPISDRMIVDPNVTQPIQITKNNKKQFWITIPIHSDVIQGTYQKTILIKSFNAILKTINLNIQVLPITLLNPNVEYGIYYRGKINTSGSISSESKTIEQFTAEQLDMVAHGISSATLYNTNFAQELQIRKSCGFSNTNLYSLGLNINSTSQQISDALSVCSQYGVETLFLYGYDESNLELVRARISAVHSEGVMVFCSQSAADAYTVADILDVAIVALDLDSVLAAAYHSYGHKIFSYSNPQTVPEYPRAFRLNYGLLLWQYDYDGVMDYAYQHSFGDIWNDFDNTAYRDHVLAYPTANGVIDTVQWEGFREAVNDMRYLATLQNAITAAQTRGVVTTDIETWLATLKTTDLKNTDLDGIRSRMIDYILELQSSENHSAVLTADGNPILFINNTQLFLED